MSFWYRTGVQSSSFSWTEHRYVELYDTGILGDQAGRLRRRWLLDGAASVFEGGGPAAEGTAGEAQVDLLYRQIGQLKVENDFLARKLGK